LIFILQNQTIFFIVSGKVDLEASNFACIFYCGSIIKERAFCWLFT
jgi:hypothetical protein